MKKPVELEVTLLLDPSKVMSLGIERALEGLRLSPDGTVRIGDAVYLNRGDDLGTNAGHWVMRYEDVAE